MSTSSNMRDFMSRFRVQDNSLMSFSRAERNQILDFQAFSAQKPDGVCCVCLRKLYVEEVGYRKIENINFVNCSQWNITPFTQVDNSGVTKYMVCKDHLMMRENEFPIYVYPGMCITMNNSKYD